MNKIIIFECTRPGLFIRWLALAVFAEVNQFVYGSLYGIWWYLIVSIPDLCPLSYYHMRNTNIVIKHDFMHLDMLGPKSGAESWACKQRVLTTSGGIEDVMQQLSMFRCYYQIIHIVIFAGKFYTKSVLKISVFVLPILAQNKAWEMHIGMINAYLLKTHGSVQNFTPFGRHLIMFISLHVTFDDVIFVVANKLYMKIKIIKDLPRWLISMCQLRRCFLYHETQLFIPYFLFSHIIELYNSKLRENSQYKSKKEGKDQELIQSSTSPDQGYQWESDNLAIRHQNWEPWGKPFPSRLPQGITKKTRKHNKTRQK